MSTKILAMLVVTVAFFQVGCGKSKKEKLEQAAVQSNINACMFDPTGQCQARAKLMLENPQLAGQINAVSTTAVQNGATGVVQKTSDGQIVPVLPQSIKEQAMKVQSALAADSANPRSLHYDPATSTVSVSAREPASASASTSSLNSANVSSVSESPSSSASTMGETFR